MRKQKFVGFRATEDERQKLDHLTRQTGLSASELLRRLVSSVELHAVTTLEPVMRYEFVIASPLDQSNKNAEESVL